MIRIPSAIVLLAATAVAQDHVFTLGFASALGPASPPPTPPATSPDNASHPVARVKDNDLDGVIQVPTELHTFLSTCYHTTGGACFMTAVRSVVRNGEYEFYFTDSEQGRVIRGVDSNHNGLLDRGEDTNGNGVLDVGEDVNGNGILDTEVSEFFFFGMRLAPDTVEAYFDPISGQVRVYVGIDTTTGTTFVRGIYKLVDGNGDGDAKDAGESSVFVNSTIPLTTPGLGTPLPNFWQTIRVLPGGKIVAYASGVQYTATSTLTNENCFYGFTDNGGPTAATVELFFNPSTLNVLPRHPDFQNGTYPIWDIDYVNTTTGLPSRRSFARWIAVAPQGGTAGVVPAYYFASSYTWSAAGNSSGDLNSNGEHVSGLIYRVNDFNNNQVIDAGELSLWCNMSGAPVAGVAPASFTNLINGTPISTLIDRTWSLDATKDGAVHFSYANGGGADGIVTIRDTSFDEVIQTGEITMTYATTAPAGVFPAPFNPRLGPFFPGDNSLHSLNDGAMPGPFGAGLAVVGEGCTLPSTGLNTLMDAWGGIPQQGNANFKVGTIRGVPFFPVIMTLDGALQPFPIPLAGVGFPAGCNLYTVNPQIFAFTFADAAGRAVINTGIPVNPGLVGQTAVFQGAVLDVASPASIQWHTTNALLVTIQP